MPWLIPVIAGGLVLSAGLHHLGPALAVLVGTGVPLAVLAALAARTGLRRLRVGDIASGVALEAVGLVSILLVVAVGRWAWVNYF